MKTPTDVQIISQGGKPAFAVVPYEQYLALIGHDDDAEVYIPTKLWACALKKA